MGLERGPTGLEKGQSGLEQGWQMKLCCCQRWNFVAGGGRRGELMDLEDEESGSVDDDR
jgi:hypothetical protein